MNRAESFVQTFCYGNQHILKEYESDEGAIEIYDPWLDEVKRYELPNELDNSLPLWAIKVCQTGFKLGEAILNDDIGNAVIIAVEFGKLIADRSEEQRLQQQANELEYEDMMNARKKSEAATTTETPDESFLLLGRLLRINSKKERPDAELTVADNAITQYRSEHPNVKLPQSKRFLQRYEKWVEDNSELGKRRQLVEDLYLDLLGGDCTDEVLAKINPDVFSSEKQQKKPTS